MQNEEGDKVDLYIPRKWYVNWTKIEEIRTRTSLLSMPSKWSTIRPYCFSSISVSKPRTLSIKLCRRDDAVFSAPLAAICCIRSPNLSSRFPLFHDPKRRL
eukprot:TRINITY_DN171_c0_g1_i2.p2 TRINITY_DN171_c0_g1~~TRINITY_DN171_c0_g1_i2.p2  ORF type:complete len:101 (-),score=9.40 TRINITY_DN171_c0_g1_i2:723-1025(-)